MRVGLDFDNTIVSYDALFHKIALEKGLITDSNLISKISVREHLRQAGKEYEWTKMQGEVYGARMNEAQAYPGILRFIEELKIHGHSVYIVSHKSRFPYAGPLYDLQLAAAQWVKENLVLDGVLLVPNENIFFETTKNNKIKRIASLKFDLFVDDLLDIFLDEEFPKDVRGFLFDPSDHYKLIDFNKIEKFHSWNEIEKHVFNLYR